MIVMFIIVIFINITSYISISITILLLLLLLAISYLLLGTLVVEERKAEGVVGFKTYKDRA